MFPEGVAPGWRARPSYGKRGWLPVPDRNRRHGWRRWRQARQFEPLQSRLLGNRLCGGGEPYCPYRFRDWERRPPRVPAIAPGETSRGFWRADDRAA